MIEDYLKNQCSVQYNLKLSEKNFLFILIMDLYPRSQKMGSLKVLPGFNKLSGSTQKLLAGIYSGKSSYRNSLEFINNPSIKYLKLAPLPTLETTKSQEVKLEPKSPIQDFIETPKIQNPKRRVSRCAYLSQKGQINGFDKPQNQDGVLFLPQPNQTSHQFLFGVFDGHGASGHLVSSFIRSSIRSSQASLPLSTSLEDLKFFVTSSISHATKSLDQSEVDTKHSGSTLCLVLISGSSVVCGNIGDSRCIVGVYKDSWSFEALSKDHKPSDAEESKRIKKMGGIITDSFFDGVSNQVLRVWSGKPDEPALAMTRCIGDKNLKKIGVVHEPEIMTRTLDKNDKFLILASDGLWDVIDSMETVMIVSREMEKGHAKNACEVLLNEARKRWARKSSDIDDISIVIALLNSE